MVSYLNAFKATFRTTSHRFRSTGGRLPVELPGDGSLEEETLPLYESDQFCPVDPGDVFNARYRVAGKLGFGAYSTSWLCQDLQSKNFVTMKVSTSLRKFPTATDREFKTYEHLASIKSTHPGQSLIRELWDSFELTGCAGKHRCLILQPMHMTLLEMMKLNPRPFDLPLLKMTLTRLLLALDFLHTEAHIIHCDLKTDNLMLSLEDSTLLADFAEEEIKQPSPRKVINQSRTIYQSRRFRRPSKGRSYGLPVLCDFGEARIGDVQESSPFVRPHIYRAPEIIFQMKWGSAADIWNLGALVSNLGAIAASRAAANRSLHLDLFEGHHMFGDIFDSNGEHDPFKHLSLMVALIGPPPGDFVRRGETTSQCFDHSIAWITHDDVIVPSISLEELELRLSGSEKTAFLDFLRSMLKWLPEERKTAKQLLDDPWLR